MIHIVVLIFAKYTSFFQESFIKRFDESTNMILIFVDPQER